MSISYSFGRIIVPASVTIRSNVPAVGRESRKCRLIALLAFALFMSACGGKSPALPITASQSCDPSTAPEVISVTATNIGSEDLLNYPIAVPIQTGNFDFSLAAPDGSNVGAWDQSSAQLSHWLESYDATIGKGMIWVKIPSLVHQSSATIRLTGGEIVNCSLAASNGYAVFPFFSDAQDVKNWQIAGGNLSITNTVTTGPISVQQKQVIESDGMYNDTPSVVNASNGDWVLSYRKGINHVNSPEVILRRSHDAGQTWNPEVPYFNTSVPDPTLARTPGGNLLIEFAKQDPNGVTGAAYARSLDNGFTWNAFTFFDQPVSNTYAFPTAFINIGQSMYGVSYGPSSGGLGNSPFFWSSGDDGRTWTKISELRQGSDPGANETAIIQTGPGELFAVSRADNGIDTYGRFSADMGTTWGPLISYTPQVGALNLPQLIQSGSALLLLGREALGIPGVQPPNTIGFPRQLVAFVSYDAGRTFSYGTVLDTYTGQQIDGGYSWPMLLPDGRIFVVYDADSHNLRLPDIKSLLVTVNETQTSPSNAIHVFSQIAPGDATRPVALSSTKYSLDFRFSSNLIPAGSQFSVALQDQNSGQSQDLVRWELPSTHAADPTSDSGFFAAGQFVQALSAFNYGSSYRIRTILDEVQGSQEAEILDGFGQITSTLPMQPPAQTTAGHVRSIQIGNHSSLRATDTLLDFILLRPVAEFEPAVTVLRVR